MWVYLHGDITGMLCEGRSVGWVYMTGDSDSIICLSYIMTLDDTENVDVTI